MISIDDVTVAFGGSVLLDRINFHISESDKIGLVGKNGAGKSTILKMICGLQNPTSGQIDRPKELEIGYLPQIMQHNRGRSVLEETMTAFASSSEIEGQIAKINAELCERTDYESDSYSALIERLNELNDRLNIANSVNRLKNSKAKSKVVIMLTDGSNNRGEISPFTAADIAKKFNIRVYTIGVGTNGTARYPMSVGGFTQYVNMPVEIDTKTLQHIANTTDGQFFRATDNESLRNVYNEIDKLEKTKMRVNQYSTHSEEFFPFVLAALVALALELLLRTTLLKRIP